jgi:hypothetical protein
MSTLKVIHSIDHKRSILASDGGGCIAIMSQFNKVMPEVVICQNIHASHIFYFTSKALSIVLSAVEIAMRSISRPRSRACVRDSRCSSTLVESPRDARNIAYLSTVLSPKELAYIAMSSCWPAKIR